MSTPSPSALPEVLPHTPEPPRPYSPLLAHASPLAVFDPDINDEHEKPQAPPTADVVASDVAFDEVSEGDVSVTISQFLPTTPEVHTIGRTGFNRKSVFLKVVVMHLYAARCMVTLTSNCLQMAHVIPVSASASFLRFLEHIFGDEPNTLNRHSSRNIWLLDASMHHNIDRGLIKLVPARRTVYQIQDFTTLISQVRIRRLEREYDVKIVKLTRGHGYKIVLPDEPEWDAVSNEHQEMDANLDALIAKADTKDSKLRRTNIFPPALYPYLVIGIFCHEEFTFTRQVVNNPQPPSGPMTGATPFKIPLEIPTDMLEKEQIDKFGRVTSFPFLRGIKDKKKEFEIVDPLEYDKNKELKLGQDPV